MLSSAVVPTGMRRWPSLRSISACTVRVPKSAAGALRETEPVYSVPSATSRSRTAVPTSTTAKSLSGTSISTRTFSRLSRVRIGDPGRANPPGSVRRSETSPSNGARKTQSSTSSPARTSRAWAANSSASLLWLSAVRRSTSLGDTYPPDSSPVSRPASLVTASCVALSARACCCKTLLCAEALLQSSVANTCPFLATSPGRTRTVST